MILTNQQSSPMWPWKNLATGLLMLTTSFGIGRKQVKWAHHLRDRWGWPVERIKGKPITNFIRLVLHTNLRRTIVGLLRLRREGEG